jgi:hypothetical protein
MLRWILDIGARQIAGCILLGLTVWGVSTTEYPRDWSGLLALWLPLVAAMIVPRMWLPAAFIGISALLFVCGVYTVITLGTANGMLWFEIACFVFSAVFLLCAKLKRAELGEPMPR